MNERLTAIQRRRDDLVARARDQRQALGDLVKPWRTGLALTDHVIALARDLRAQWFTLAAGGVLIGMGRGRFSVWIARIWTVWEVYRALRKPGPR